MKLKLFAIFTLSVFLFNTALIAQNRVRPRAVINTAEIVSLLPASDAVAVIDVKRFLNTALPQMLSGNQQMLAEVTRGLDEAKTKTGIDFRQFDIVTAGFTAIKVKEKEYDFDSVIIARGQIKAGALIAAAKLASNGKYREEKVGERTIYIFEPKEIAEQNLPQTQGKAAGMIKKTLGGFSKEMAVTALDAGTLAFGSIEKVKETLAGTSKVGTDVSGLLNKTTSSVMTFAARVPEGMSVFLPLENDQLGKDIDSIKYLFGTMDVSGNTTSISATARTLQTEQAVSLRDTLEGLQMLGKAFLGNAKGADKKVYARLIENVKFTAKGNDVSMDLLIAQTDMNFLVGLLAKK